MWASTVLRASAVTTAVAASSLVAAAPVHAGARAVEEFAVTFAETSCPSVADPLLARLSVRFTDKRQPDGTAHHWIDLAGTITNEVTGDQVHLRATRRFFEDEPDDQSRFAGLQSRFTAWGHGVLHLNAGWASGALSEPIAEHATRGRWDGIRAALPASVCEVLEGAPA